jgi:cytochrome P450
MSTLSPDVPDILSDEHDDDPQPAYRYLREEAPAVFHPGSDSWLVSRHADVSRLLRAKEVSSKNYGDGLGLIFGRTVLELDGKEHQKHRLLLNPLMNGIQLVAMQPMMLGVVTDLFLPELAKSVAARPGGVGEAEIDLVPTYFGELPISVIETMLDLPKERHEDFSRWYKAMHAFTANIAGLPGPIEAGLQARKELTEYVLPLITERRANPGTDLISGMCQAEIDGEKLTDEEVRAFVSLMITAGGETTDRALGLIMLNLLQHPAQLEAVKADRSLIANAFVETLRYSPPVNIAGRMAEEDIELHGATIPAGAKINCLIGAANRDETKFSDPHSFDIFRDDNSVERGFSGAADHLGFAKGRHLCVGAALAKAEVEIALNLIFDHMPDIRLADGFVPRPTGLWTRGVDELRVAFTPS